MGWCARSFFSKTILLEEEWSCDFAITGNAIKSFYDLIVSLKNNSDLSNIAGVAYQKGKDVFYNPPDDTKFETINYRDILCSLIKD
jgi:radical SAM superfamily enzyme YgiQ (UPF0313 family)